MAAGAICVSGCDDQVQRHAERGKRSQDQEANDSDVAVDHSQPHFLLSRFGQDAATWLVRLQIVHSMGENEGGLLARPRPFALGG